ncbi:copper amine oxidase N-terminal domain-containing protein [Thermoanaerobacterium thermosaccharolyticum]|uniref:copper amine oxidase N-terminal domain-containing protein n=1 Tax=Thermoanaerobacterium thermosaccharolyticum TaxID=1517 RepID=UPI002FD95E2E
MKSSKRWLSIFMVLAMIIGTIGFMPSVAKAGTGYSVITTVPQFNSNSDSASNLDLAEIKVEVDNAMTSINSSALFQVVDSQGKILDINSAVPDTAITTTNAVYRVDKVSSNTYRINVSSNDNNKEADVYLKINVNAKNAASGDIQVQFFNAQGQLINGSVVAATANSTQVQVAALTTQTFGDSGATVVSSAYDNRPVIRISEAVAGSLKVATDSVKLKLPNGFKWDTKNVDIQPIAGSVTDVARNVYSPAFNKSFDDSDRTLKIEFKGYQVNNTIVSSLPSGLSVSKIIADIKAGVLVDDTSVAKYGDVNVTVSGSSTVTPDSITIGTYGDYSATAAKYEDPKVVDSGKMNQDIAKFAIKEDLAGSLIAGRTIILTLPDQAKWVKYPKFDSGDSSNHVGFSIKDFEAVGTDGHTIKATINSASTGNKSTTLVFDNGQITVQGDYTGDITLTVSGSAGATGTVTVATAKAPVTATVSSTPNVIIGQSNQAAGDVILTESKSEAVQSSTYNGSSAYLDVSLPSGVTFASAPTFTVTKGDLQLDGTVTKVSDSEYKVRVKASSSTPSTIKISNIKLTVDRTVPVGDLKLKIGGTALVENTGDNYYPNNNTLVEPVVAKVATPAPTNTTANVVFTIGSTSYTVNGTTQTMDVAPYVKNGRTYLPVRYVAQALGVSNDNILYNNGVVTLMKDNTIVQLTIGSNVMVVNGVSITMDTPAEISNGRTMLPFRWIAQAFGAQVNYDANAKTVTITK